MQLNDWQRKCLAKKLGRMELAHLARVAGLNQAYIGKVLAGSIENIPNDVLSRFAVACGLVKGRGQPAEVILEEAELSSLFFEPRGAAPPQLCLFNAGDRSGSPEVIPCPHGYADPQKEICSSCKRRFSCWVLRGW